MSRSIPHPAHPPRRLHPVTVGGALAAVVVAVVVGFAVAGESGGRGSREAFVYTGELSSMNLPVIETPGEASGTIRIAAVEVEGASWSLGDVPLDTAVLPRWTLRNTGHQQVSIGEPHAQVREGCCPGPVTLDRRVIQPGEEATMTFELAMHTGMDGWHDIAVHVPVTVDGAEHTLDLEVSGTFGDPRP
jgi:hypothetical protein